MVAGFFLFHYLLFRRLLFGFLLFKRLLFRYFYLATRHLLSIASAASGVSSAHIRIHRQAQRARAVPYPP